LRIFTQETLDAGTRMTALSDEALLERLRTGDRGALGEIYERYKSRLYGYCFRLLRDEADAQDAVQEAFIKLSFGIGLIMKDAAFRTWIYRVARNESLMILRRRQTRSSTDPDTLFDDRTPQDDAEEHDAVTAVHGALARLSLEYREALVLREFDGMSYAEIASLTESSLEAVKARIFRARRALARELEDVFPRKEAI
jgi:RNA polymerase sigma-70 factor, ECF subfamily